MYVVDFFPHDVVFPQGDVVVPKGDIEERLLKDEEEGRPEDRPEDEDEDVDECDVCDRLIGPRMIQVCSFLWMINTVHCTVSSTALECTIKSRTVVIFAMVLFLNVLLVMRYGLGCKYY